MIFFFVKQVPAEGGKQLIGRNVCASLKPIAERFIGIYCISMG